MEDKSDQCKVTYKTLQCDGNNGGNIMSSHMKSDTQELWWDQAAQRNIYNFKVVAVWKSTDYGHFKTTTTKMLER